MAREPWLLDSTRFCRGAAVAVSSSSSAIPLLTLLPRGDDGGDENEGLGDTLRRVLDRNLSRLWPRRRNPPTITGSCHGETVPHAPAHGRAPMPTRRSRVETLCERASWTRQACMGLPPVLGGRRGPGRARQETGRPCLPPRRRRLRLEEGEALKFLRCCVRCARVHGQCSPATGARTYDGLDASAANSRWGQGVVMLGSKPKLENQRQAGTRHC